MLKNLAQPETVNSQHYDFVVVGSGFGSGFFLSKLLETITGRVLVIERGDYNAHSWQVNENRNSSIDRATTYHSDSDKPWNFTNYYAIHGYKSVPAYPASHGCVRIPNWEADALESSFFIGMPVHVWDVMPVIPGPVIIRNVPGLSRSAQTGDSGSHWM